MEGKVTPTFRAHPGFPQPSDAAIAFLKSLLTRNPEVRADSARALNSTYISSSSKPASISLPSFGPTLSIAHDTTKDEPKAETPLVRDVVEDVSSEDSTTCGESGDDKSSEDD